MACSDPLVIQRLLDGDLDETQAEIVARHVLTCVSCRSETKALSELRAFIQDQLGIEDEGEEEKSAATLAEIARRLPPPLARHPDAPWWRRRILLATAAALALTLLAPIPFLSKAMARPAEILERGAARERMWRYQPNTVLHWEVDTVSRGVKNVADGRWRTVFWRKNGARSFEETVRQLDPRGRTEFAYWRQPDGSMVRYRPAGTIEVFPSPAAVRSTLPTLPPELRATLEAWLEQRHMTRSLEAQSRRDVDLVEGRSSWVRGGEATFSRGVLGLLGEVHHIRVVKDGGSNPMIVRAVHEYDIESESLRLLRLKTTVTYADGTVGIHDSRWVAYREGTTAEFEAQIPRDLLESGTPVVRLTPLELATRRLKETAGQ
ncbi:MAG: anti-sigma factor family protein [Thermoanaerobaculia bacterium]